MAGDHAQGLLMLLPSQQLACQEPGAAGEPAPAGSEEPKLLFSRCPTAAADVILLPDPGMFNLLLRVIPAGGIHTSMTDPAQGLT